MDIARVPTAPDSVQQDLLSLTGELFEVQLACVHETKILCHSLKHSNHLLNCVVENTNRDVELTEQLHELMLSRREFVITETENPEGHPRVKVHHKVVQLDKRGDLILKIENVSEH